MSPSSPTTVAEEHEELKQVVRAFEAATGINIRAWARRPNPTAEYADPDSLVCDRCGLRQKGLHRDWLECMITYREMFGRQQLLIEQLMEKIRRASGRSTSRILVLCGERMCLSDAARALDMTPKALRHRIARRLGKNWEDVAGETDLAAIGIEKRYARRSRERSGDA